MRCCTGNHRRCRAAAGCLLAVVAQLAVASGPGVHGRVLELDTEGKITGTVTGAAIEYQNQSGAAAGQATSGKGGYYRVDLPPGKYYFKVTAAGYKDEDHGRGIALQRSEGYAVYNLSLTKGPNDPDRKPPVIETVELGKLSGRVFEAGPEGERTGVPWATISLRRTGGDRELVRVASGDKDPKAGREAGQYAIVIAAGTWQASVSAKGFQTLVDPEPIVIDPAKPAVRDFLLTRPVPEPVKGQGIKGLTTIDNPELSPQAKSAVLSRVEVYISPYWNPAKPENPVSLDAKGNYSRDLPEGRYRVIAVAKEYKTARSGPVDVFVGKYSVVNLTLVPEVKPEPKPEPLPVERLVFQGTVYEQTADTEARPPLPGATVLIRTGNQAMSEAPRGTTDSQGQVKLEVAAAGEYTVLAQKSGYEPGGARVTIAAGAANSQAITLSRTSTPPEPDVPTKKTVAVTGYVVYRDAASPTGYWGVKGAQVIWIRPGVPGSRNLVVVADRVGKFGLELPEGTYQVNVEPSAGLTGASQEVVVRQGMKPKYFILQRGEEIEPEPQPGQLVRVQGYVMTRSRTSRTGYAGVAGAKILWAGGPQRPLPTVTTDRSGRFSIDLAEAGYDVAVEAPPGYKNTTKGVFVRRGMQPVSFVLERAGVEPGPKPYPGPVPDGLATLNVRVLVGGMPLVTPPVPGAEVVILQNNRTVASGRADLLGNASFRLKPGSYEIEARLEGYESYGSSPQRVTLQGGVNKKTIFLKRAVAPKPEPPPEHLVRVQGHVMTQSPTSRGHVGVAGAKIIWTGRSGRPLPAVTSDRSGRFSIDLEAGAYNAAVQAPPGYENTSKGVVVQRGMGMVSFVLQREGRTPPRLAALAVRVVAAGVPLVTPPLPGAEVVILQHNQTVASGRADLTGSASFRLKPGSYEIQARFEGYASSRQMVTLQGGANRETIFLKRAVGPEPGPQPQGQIAFTLRVVEKIAVGIPGAPSRSSPIAGAQVNVMQNRRSVLTGQTNRAGVYSGRLPPGNYQVSVTRQGFQPNQVALNLARNAVSLEIVLNPKSQSPETPSTLPSIRPDTLPGMPTLPGPVRRRPILPGPTRPRIPILRIPILE